MGFVRQNARVCHDTRGNDMKIGIIAAMESELDLLKAQMGEYKATTIAGVEFYEGKLGGREVAMVVGGVGKVNSAVHAQLLISKFGVDALVFTGVAGSLDPKIDICDIVVSTDCVQHDVEAVALGYAPGEIPYQEVSFFKADENLRKAAVRVVGEVAPEVHVFEGRVASGDQFVSSAEAKERIVSNFGALCCEMEGAAVAHVAWLNNVPYVVIRAISDKADGSAHMDYPTFVAQAADRSASIIEHLVAQL